MALPEHKATRPGEMCFGLPTLLTSSHCTSRKEYNDSGIRPTLFSPRDDRLAWANCRSLRLGTHVCVGRRSGAICVGPVSGNRYMVKFDDDGSTSGYLQHTQLVRVPFTQGDSVHVQGRRGVIVCDSSSNGVFKMRFDDDGTTSV